MFGATERHAHEQAPTHGRNMRTRTFIGLILLVAALLVASTPALLTPTAKGVEHVAVQAGIMPDVEAAERKEKQRQEQAAEGAADPALALKGFSREKNGDLRDTVTNNERASNQRGRLEAGDRRVRMPGQLENQDAYSPPIVLEEGAMLLDSTGCPMMPTTAEEVAYIATDEGSAAYGQRVANADDPTTCQADLLAAVKAVNTGPTSILPGDRRRIASSVRSDSDRWVVDLHMWNLWRDMFSDYDTATTDAMKARRGLGAATSG